MTFSGPVASTVQLLTIPEAGERLRCSESHVYRLIAVGKIRAIDVAQPGSRKPKTRVSESDLAAYIKGGGGAA
jgi:excisionase family DNA binding protein